MTHILCPYCGKITTVVVTGEETSDYEALLNLPDDITDLQEKIDEHEDFIDPEDGSLLTEYEITESMCDLQEYHCAACEHELAPDEIYAGALAHLLEKEKASA